MRFLDTILNNFVYGDKYKTHSEAVVIACYFNPQNNPYRLKAFNAFYDSIKHLNHRIIECVIGDAQPQLPENKNIRLVHTVSTLWHKEALLNNIIEDLDPKFKYVFWLDTDVIFSNKNWLVEGVKQLQTNKMIQPFEYCVHLDKNEKPSDFPVGHYREYSVSPTLKHPRMWRSFSANYVSSKELAANEVYDAHGHVGFAWGARRDVLDIMPLYDRALVGGADHIMAHAAAGHIPHKCITKSFTQDIDAVNRWSRDFYDVVGGSIGYVQGDLFHIWHGTLESREYLKRVREFTPEAKKIVNKDKNGLYVTNNDTYVKSYFEHREVKDDTDDGFLTSMAIGYATDNGVLGGVIGGNMVGGMIGDMLNDSDDHHNHNHDTDFSNNVDNDNFS